MSKSRRARRSNPPPPRALAERFQAGRLPSVPHSSPGLFEGHGTDPTFKIGLSAAFYFTCPRLFNRFPCTRVKTGKNIYHECFAVQGRKRKHLCSKCIQITHESLSFHSPDSPDYTIGKDHTKPVSSSQNYCLASCITSSNFVIGCEVRKTTVTHVSRRGVDTRQPSYVLFEFFVVEKIWNHKKHKEHIGQRPWHAVLRAEAGQQIPN